MDGLLPAEEFYARAGLYLPMISRSKNVSSVERKISTLGEEVLTGVREGFIWAVKDAGKRGDLRHRIFYAVT